MDAKHLLAAKRRRTRTVYVVLDDEPITERERLVGEAAVAEKQDAWLNRRPEAPAIQDRIRELDVLIAESKVPVVFAAMPRTRWVELWDQYTDADDELDLEGFGPEIIAASWIDDDGQPAASLDDVQELWGTWSAAETEQLYIAAFRVNREVRDIPFTSPGIERTGSSDSNSTTASQEE